MPNEWFWTNGHIGWPLFAFVVYTLAIVLIADLAWRLLVVSTRWLAAAITIVWLVGLTALWLVWC